MTHSIIQLQVPGSKSITNRALLCAAMARGKSVIEHVLESDDTKWMIAALQSLGVVIKKQGGSYKIIYSPWKKPRKTLYCGNSGTTLRFLAAALSTQPFACTLDGDERMRQRPVADLADALRELGASVEFLKKAGFPPLRISGPWKNGKCGIRGNVSSQFLSGLLLAAPFAKRKVTIEIEGMLTSRTYADLTIDVMRQFGVTVRRSGYKKFIIGGKEEYMPRRFAVEGDASSASYFWGISVLTGESIEITNVPEHSIQPDAAFKKITAMFLQTKGLQKISCENFPDSAMTLAVLAAFRKGKTVLTGLSNLRVKECNRLRALVAELKKIGAGARELRDGLEIIGRPERLRAARIKTYNDHRMAMCFGMAGFVIPGMKIENYGCVAKTYPNFWKDLKRLKQLFLNNNLIITGMRGSGKSKLGALTGRALGRRFIDLDREIERKAGRSISEIVERKGWKYFRKLESAVAKKAAQLKGAVISTGGGTLMNPHNAAILKKNAKVIYLSCSTKILKKRLAGKTDRPSLGGKQNFLDELDEVMKKREPVYRSVADEIIEVSANTLKKHSDLEKKVFAILQSMKRWGMVG